MLTSVPPRLVRSGALLATAVACVTGLLPGCFTVLGDDTTGVPLFGDGAQAEALPHLNARPLQSWEIQYNAAGEPWAVLCETGMTQDSTALCLPGFNGRLRVRRVREPAAPKILSGDYYFVGGFTGRRAVYVTRNGPTSTRLQVYLARDLGDGEWQPAATYDLPPGDPRVTPSPSSSRTAMFVYRVTRPKTPRMDLLYRDQQQRRVFTFDARDTLDDDPFFDSTGTWFFARVNRAVDRDLILSDPARFGDMRHLYVTDLSGANKDQDLGLRPRGLLLHPLGKQALLSCGADGLREVLYGPAREKAPEEDRDKPLDLPPPCDPGKLSLDYTQALVLYDLGDLYRRVPLSGGPADFIPKVKRRRVLARSADGVEAYSQDPVGLYSNDASDGWIGDTRFMTRGLFGYFSQDSKRIRYVENAATPLSVGDLYSAPVPGRGGAGGGGAGGGAGTTLLARNVPWPYFFDLAAPDGRTLAISNAAVFPGPFNRLIAIDEAAGRAQLLMEGANNFRLLTATGDLLVELVNSESGFDLVRLPLPKK